MTHVNTIFSTDLHDFEPSEILIQIIKNNSTIPKEVQQHISEQLWREQITDTLYGTITYIAKYFKRTGNYIQISNDSGFTLEFEKMLQERLCQRNMRFTGRLYKEFFKFLIDNIVGCEWGRIYIHYGNIKININDDAFNPIDFDKIINDDNWEIA